MNIPHPQKIISISQIVNRTQARYRIHFNSEEEFNDPDYWRQIIKKRAEFAHYDAIVVDHTPEEDIDGLKKFSILYGLKYLFAAEMLDLDVIPVRVLPHPEELDSNIVAEFFDTDYLSLSSYEKGMFVDNLRKKRNLTYNQLAAKSGFSYSALQNMGAAYLISRNYLPLEDAYKHGKVTVSIILHSKSIFESTSDTIHQQLTDYIVENGKYANELLREAISNRDKGILATQAVLNAISSDTISELKGQDIDEQICMHLKADGLEIPDEEQRYISERMKSDRKFSIQMQSYRTIREKCFGAYENLRSILPPNLVLDFETALTLPDRTQFSYAVPSEMKKLCRNQTPRDLSGKRIFSRIIEYIQKAGFGLSGNEIMKWTRDFYEDYYTQRQFAIFFKFSILYRNFRSKVISIHSMPDDYLHG